MYIYQHILLTNINKKNINLLCFWWLIGSLLHEEQAHQHIINMWKYHSWIWNIYYRLVYRYSCLCRILICIWNRNLHRIWGSLLNILQDKCSHYLENNIQQCNLDICLYFYYTTSTVLIQPYINFLLDSTLVYTPDIPHFMLADNRV